MRDTGTRTEADAAAFERHYAEDYDDDRPTQAELESEMESRIEHTVVPCRLPFAGDYTDAVVALPDEKPCVGDLIIAAQCELAYDHDGACDPEAGGDPWFIPMTLAYYQWQEDPANAPF